MNIRLAHVQKFFFESMLKGWISENPVITPVPDMPGYEQIEVIDGPWRCLDRWGSPPDSIYSSGTTHIWYQDVPIWVMTYGGKYEKKAIPLLKDALGVNYQGKIFHGGRGPLTKMGYDGGAPQQYINRCQGTFVNFSGREDISAVISSKNLGYHVYGGMSLVPLN